MLETQLRHSMDMIELDTHARRQRFMREVGVALLTAAVVLTLILQLPLVLGSREPVAEAVATTTVPNAFASVPVVAEAAIVYDLTTGETLYAKNAEAQLPLASLTKLLAVYSALDNLSPTAPITIPDAVVAEAEAPRAFNAGQVLSLGDLSRLTLTASLNDGAAAIVEAVATERNTTKQAALTETAQRLNLTQTYALNGSGLDMTGMISGGYGSARDMARLAGALVVRAPEIARATSEKTATATTKGGTTFVVKNTDPVVDMIPHLLLSKTGFTDLAGGNLALVIDVGVQHPVAIVVMGSTVDARFTDSLALMAATFAHFAGLASL